MVEMPESWDIFHTRNETSPREIYVAGRKSAVADLSESLIPVREPAVLHSFFGTVFPYYASFLEW